MIAENNWQDKSIEVLEKYSYGDPLTAPTPLVGKCFEYVKIPVSNLSIEQLRLLIGQKIGLPYLIPLALEQLNKNILAEGDLYEGDLLKSVTDINIKFWKEYPDLYESLIKLIKKGRQKIKQSGLGTFILPNL